MAARKAKAYCWRSGLIQFSRFDVPDGAVEIRCPFVNEEEFRFRIMARARHAYNGALLVPGVPESESDLEAEYALQDWLETTFPENQEAVH